MNLDDLSVTAGVGRDVLESRIALLVTSVRQLQGTVHPDPTADLMAAEVLPAPIGGGITSRASQVAIAIFGFAAAVGFTYGALYDWDNRRRILG